MGMGEPLHNYDATMAAVRILTDDHGFAVHPRRITLSTVGVVPAIERLAGEDVMPRLAVSLHAPTDEQRAALVPVNRKYPIADIIEACRRFPPARRGRITFEYVLLAGVNDSPADARRLRAPARPARQGQPDPAQPGGRIPFDRPPTSASTRSAGRWPSAHHRDGAQEPRAGHQGGLRAAGGGGRQEVGRATTGRRDAGVASSQ